VPGQGCRVSLGNPTTRESLDTQTQTHGLTPSLRHSLHFCLVLVYIFYISEFTSLADGQQTFPTFLFSFSLHFLHFRVHFFAFRFKFQF